MRKIIDLMMEAMELYGLTLGGGTGGFREISPEHNAFWLKLESYPSPSSREFIVVSEEVFDALRLELHKLVLAHKIKSLETLTAEQFALLQNAIDDAIDLVPQECAS